MREVWGSIPGPVSSVVKHIAVDAGGLDLIPGLVDSVAKHITIGAGGLGFDSRAG